MEVKDMSDEIDTEKLRKDMRDDSLGAYFGGGFGGALNKVGEIERASTSQLTDMAKRQGINLDNYKKK
jgi:hypothetical protein